MNTEPLDPTPQPDRLDLTLALAFAGPALLEACIAAHQCITDFLAVYKSGATMLVMDEAVHSLEHDALKLVKKAIQKATTPI